VFLLLHACFSFPTSAFFVPHACNGFLDSCFCFCTGESALSDFGKAFLLCFGKDCRVEPDNDSLILRKKRVEPDNDSLILRKKRVEPDNDSLILRKKRVEPIMTA